MLDSATHAWWHVWGTVELLAVTFVAVPVLSCYCRKPGVAATPEPFVLVLDAFKSLRFLDIDLTAGFSRDGGHATGCRSEKVRWEEARFGTVDL